MGTSLNNAQQEAEHELHGEMSSCNAEPIRYLIANAGRLTKKYLQDLYVRGLLGESRVHLLVREARMSQDCFTFMLETAVESGWLDVVRFLIEEKNLATRPSHASRSTLAHKAAIADRSDIMAYLLSKDPELATCALPRGYTPLHAAASHRALEIVKLLIKRKVPLDPIYTGSPCGSGLMQQQRQKDLCGLTPLHRAANKGHVHIVRCLVRAGARIDIKDQNGLTPYDHACKQKKKHVADYLRRQQQEVEQPSREGQPSSSSHSSAARVSRKRLRDGEGEATEQKRQSLGSSLSLPGMKEMMVREISKSCAKEMREMRANQLYRVTKQEHANLLTYHIFLYPQYVHVKDAEGHGLLHYAAAHSNLEGYFFLKGKGASLTDRTSEGATLLHYAAIGGDCAIIQDLLTSGLSKIDKCGGLMTPFDFALMCEHKDAALLLQNSECYFHKILTRSTGNEAE